MTQQALGLQASSRRAIASPASSASEGRGGSAPSFLSRSRNWRPVGLMLGCYPLPVCACFAFVNSRKPRRSRDFQKKQACSACRILLQVARDFTQPILLAAIIIIIIIIFFVIITASTISLCVVQNQKRCT